MVPRFSRRNWNRFAPATRASAVAMDASRKLEGFPVNASTFSAQSEREFHQRLRLVFDAPDLETVLRLKEISCGITPERAPKAVERLEAGFDDAMAIMGLPEHYRRRLRPTNGGGRLNQEIRRRERVIRIFPNEEPAFRVFTPNLGLDPATLLGDHSLFRSLGEATIYFRLDFG